MPPIPRLLLGPVVAISLAGCLGAEAEPPTETNAPALSPFECSQTFYAPDPTSCHPGRQDGAQCDAESYCEIPWGCQYWGTCVARKPPGARCNGTVECSRGLCDLGRGRCVLMDGADCDDDDQCETRYCDPGTSTCGLKPEGASCLVDTECESGRCSSVGAFCVFSRDCVCE